MFRVSVPDISNGRAGSLVRTRHYRQGIVAFLSTGKNTVSHCSKLILADSRSGINIFSLVTFIYNIIYLNLGRLSLEQLHCWVWSLWTPLPQPPSRYLWNLLPPPLKVQLIAPLLTLHALSHIFSRGSELKSNYFLSTLFRITILGPNQPTMRKFQAVISKFWWLMRYKIFEENIFSYLELRPSAKDNGDAFEKVKNASNLQKVWRHSQGAWDAFQEEHLDMGSSRQSYLLQDSKG